MPRLLSNLLDRIKKNLKTKAAIAKHQPFSTQNQPVHTEKTNLLFTSYSKKNVARPGQTVFFNVITRVSQVKQDIIILNYYSYLL